MLAVGPGHRLGRHVLAVVEEAAEARVLQVLRRTRQSEGLGREDATASTEGHIRGLARLGVRADGLSLGLEQLLTLDLDLLAHLGDLILEVADVVLFLG